MGESMIGMIVGIAGILIGCAGVFAAVMERRSSRKRMERMDRMLEQAAKGRFKARQYDESMESSVESKMHDFLDSSMISATQVAAERDKIKGFIADISHQTKTPISNILLYTQILKECHLESDALQALKAMEVQTEKLHFLIDTLVKLSRLEARVIQLEPRRNSLKDLVVCVRDQILPKAEQKEIEIKLSFDTESLEAVFDGKWTLEALYNIVDNSVKYTQSGGFVEIKVISYEMFSRIDVKDNGIGIRDEELGKIFGRFYRGTEVREEEGIGIGLFLSREIVSCEGGYIRVKSEVGKGSVFSVFLPRE